MKKSIRGVSGAVAVSKKRYWPLWRLSHIDEHGGVKHTWHIKEQFFSEDDWVYSVVKKHATRSGIRRLYMYDTEANTTRLQLEFVLRGNVFFHLSLWKLKGIFDRQ